MPSQEQRACVSSRRVSVSFWELPRVVFFFVFFLLRSDQLFLPKHLTSLAWGRVMGFSHNLTMASQNWILFLPSENVKSN